MPHPAAALFRRGSDPADRLLQYPGGSYAISANLIRYRILAWGLGLYVDADVYCWRPIEDADYIIGLEENDDVNSAVMKLPVDCPVLAELNAIRDGWSPPCAGDAPIRRLNDYPWGTTGPRALTHHLKKHGVRHHARPIDAFYPVHNRQTTLFTATDLTVEDLITSRTNYIHMYQSNLSRLFGGDPAPESVAGQLIKAAGID